MSRFPFWRGYPFISLAILSATREGCHTDTAEGCHREFLFCVCARPRCCCCCCGCCSTIILFCIPMLSIEHGGGGNVPAAPVCMVACFYGRTSSFAWTEGAPALQAVGHVSTGHTTGTSGMQLKILAHTRTCCHVNQPHFYLWLCRRRPAEYHTMYKPVHV